MAHNNAITSPAAINDTLNAQHSVQMRNHPIGASIKLSAILDSRHILYRAVRYDLLPTTTT